MADTERKLYDYLLNPTEEEKLEVKEKLDQAFKVQRGIEKFGYGEFLEKVVEEKQLKEGKSPEEIVEAKEQTRAYLKDLKNEDIRRLIQESELDDTQPAKKSKPEIKVDPLTGEKRWDELTAIDIADAWFSRPQKNPNNEPYQYDTQVLAIDEDDVKKVTVDPETGVMSLAETKEDYIDGFTYYDYRRKKWYTYNNGRFIPVE